MEIVRGKKTFEMDKSTFCKMIAGYRQVSIDIGTGDGRFVREMAVKFPDQFFLGIDACRDNLGVNSRKAPANTLYVAANALNLPSELTGAASQLTINFPWGSLLKGLVAGDNDLLRGLLVTALPGAALEVKLNGGALAEAGYSIEDGTNKVCTVLKAKGFAMGLPIQVGPGELRAIPATWAKRVAFGRDPQARILRGNRI